MGKFKKGKKNSAAGGNPYDKAKTATNNIFKFNTNVGQHILKNPGVAEAIVTKSFLKPTDTVLEIGPGTGNLTAQILSKVQKLVCIELDPRMAAEITKRFMGKPEQKKLEVVLGDAIKMDFPHFDVCISNTPYQISSPLVFKLLALPNPPRTSVLMFQREFAMRLVARPGDSLYCRLSVNAQFWSKVTHIMKVGRNNFRPPPQVESSVVRIEPKLGADRPGVNMAEWDGMLRICFVRKNRTMTASWLGSRETLALIERNYRVYCALNNISLDDTEMELDATSTTYAAVPEEDEWQGFMDNEEIDEEPSFFKEEAERLAHTNEAKTKSKKPKGKVAELVRAKITKVLGETELADKRAGKCDENDFLRLLLALNREGIHFA